MPDDRVSEVLRSTVLFHPGWVLLDLALWHPTQAGPPGQRSLPNRSGDTEALAMALSPEGARILGQQLLDAAAFLSGERSPH